MVSIKQKIPKLSPATVGAKLLNNAIYIILFFLFVLIVTIAPEFISWTNLTNILAQSSCRIIIALGIAGIIILQGTDLSAGRLVGLAAVVSASLLQSIDYAYRMYPNLQQLPLAVPIVLVMLCCGFFGMVNGFGVAKLHIAPFIITMGVQLVAYGVTSIYFDRPPLGAQPIGGLDERFLHLSAGTFNLGPVKIPYLTVFAIIVAGLIWFIWNKTTLGKNMYAIGGNPEAASVSGVNLPLNIITIYTLAGVLYGFAGALEAARIGSASNNTGNMYEFDAISAVVVGGVSFSGGVGSVAGVVTGVFIFTIINYGLSFIGISPYMQFVIKGIIIVTAVAIDTQKYIKRK